MLSLILEPIRHLLRLLKAHDSPAQIAGGFALGAVIGWIPTGNLIAVLLCVLLCSIRVNKSAGALGLLIFTWTGVLADPLADSIGTRLLSLPAMQPTYAVLLDLPLGAWLGFNNTVVLGSLLLATYFAFPIFWSSHLVSAWFRRRLVDRARRREGLQLVENLNLGADWGVAT